MIVAVSGVKISDMVVPVDPDFRLLEDRRPGGRRLHVDSYGLLNNDLLAVFGSLVDEPPDPNTALPRIWFALQIPQERLKDAIALGAIHAQFERDVKANLPFTYACDKGSA